MDLENYIYQSLKPEYPDALVSKRRVTKGTYIYMPPNKPFEMYQVRQGVVQIGSYTEAGQEICYDYLFRKEFFGNLRYLNGQFYEYAKAATACELLTVDLNYFKDLIVHDPKVSDWFNKTVVERWCRAESRLFKICTLNPGARLESLLKEFDYTTQDSEGRRNYIPDLLSITDIAHLTGLTRQTVSKLLKKLECGV
jgi:CRP/FNR family transcriptional regulator, cyclic AMP receptor protein